MRNNTLLLNIFAVIFLLMSFDLLADAVSGSSLAHLSVEGIVSMLALMGATWIGRRLAVERAMASYVSADLAP